jgi:redox-sensitive bicupin YhaK (pirin superfamily)
MIERILQQHRRSLGGFEVGRVLPYGGGKMVGPFIFFDHMGPTDFPAGIPRSVDVRPHPHIGLSTVTYLFEGEIMHRDSVGSEQPIRPREVNWMTAGRGITHSERFEQARREGGRLHGIQSWVALPDADEETDPAFAHYGADGQPVFEENGVWGSLVAGEAFGLKAKAVTHSPLFYVHWELVPEARVELPVTYPERAIYVVDGTVELAGSTIGQGQMAILANDGDAAVVRAVTRATVIAIGGEPLGQRFIEWNFVSSSRERILQAKSDWQAGRMKLPDLDHDEFIPLPV